MADANSIILKVNFPLGFDATYKFFKISLDATVSDAMQQIGKKMNIPDIAEFCLFIPPTETRPAICMQDSRRCKEYPLNNKDPVQFKHRLRSLVLIMLDGTKKSVELDYNIKVGDLMPMVVRRFSIPYKKIALQFEGQFLTPSLTLAEQKVPYGSSVRIVLPDSPEKGAGLPKLAASQLAEPLKTGMLCKWVERAAKWGAPKWFVLKDDLLFYYRSKQDEKPRSVIPCNEYSAREILYKAPLGKQFIFEVYLAKATTANVRPSYVLAANSDQEKREWISIIKHVFEKSETERQAKRVFGVPLANVAKQDGVPVVVAKAIEHLRAYLDVEGIFRHSGSASEIAQYKAMFDESREIDFKKTSDCHVVTGLLKLWLRELPEPLLTFSLYDAFIAAAAIGMADDKAVRIRELVGALPEAYFITLKALISFLREVVAHEDVNKMALHNVATVFGPNLLKREEETIMDKVQDIPFVNEVINVLMREYPCIFEGAQVNVVLPTGAKPEGAIKVVRALYDYAAVESNEISFSVNTRLYVTALGSDGWWTGVLSDGTSGLFPSNYVKVLLELNEDGVMQSTEVYVPPVKKEQDNGHAEDSDSSPEPEPADVRHDTDPVGISGDETHTPVNQDNQDSQSGVDAGIVAVAAAGVVTAAAVAVVASDAADDQPQQQTAEQPTEQTTEQAEIKTEEKVVSEPVAVVKTDGECVDEAKQERKKKMKDEMQNLRAQLADERAARLTAEAERDELSQQLNAERTKVTDLTAECAALKAELETTKTDAATGGKVSAKFLAEVEALSAILEEERARLFTFGDEKTKFETLAAQFVLLEPELKEPLSQLTAAVAQLSSSEYKDRIIACEGRIEDIRKLSHDENDESADLDELSAGEEEAIKSVEQAREKRDFARMSVCLGVLEELENQFQ